MNSMHVGYRDHCVRKVICSKNWFTAIQCDVFTKSEIRLCSTEVSMTSIRLSYLLSSPGELLYRCRPTPFNTSPRLGVMCNGHVFVRDNAVLQTV